MVGDDNKFVEETLSGNATAFNLLINKYKGKVHAIIYALCGDFHQAEDIAQEVFLEAHKSLSKLKEPQKFGNWLAKIAVFRTKDFLRKKPAPQLSLDTLLKKGLDLRQCIEERAELDKIIRAIISGLSKEVQIALTLKFYGNFSYKEIAEFMDVPESTIRGMLYRGTGFLRKKLLPYL